MSKPQLTVAYSASPESDSIDIHPIDDELPSKHGGGGGGGDMNSRITRIETMMESQLQLNRDIREEMRGIRSDIQNTNSELKKVERRFLDKVDENHKWVIALIVSSILVPMLLALVAK